jgi:hypothetical protein
LTSKAKDRISANILKKDADKEIKATSDKKYHL